MTTIFFLGLFGAAITVFAAGIDAVVVMSRKPGWHS
jgi:hypothetical protein